MAAAGLVLLVFSTAGIAEDSSAEARRLRGDVPAGEHVRWQLAGIVLEREALQQDLALLEAELGAAAQSMHRLSATDRRLASEIEELRRLLRSMAVGMFVGDISGPELDLSELAGVGGVIDMQWSQHLISSVKRLQHLEEQADVELMGTVEQIDGIRRDLEIVRSRLAKTRSQEAEARKLLIIAEAWDRADEAISDENGYGIAPAEKWDALRFCESSHDYRAISKSPRGMYRGAYQFDFETWKTVGGTGDPAVASASEQDARARELYARRGAQPWPTCGPRHLE